MNQYLQQQRTFILNLRPRPEWRLVVTAFRLIAVVILLSLPDIRVAAQNSRYPGWDSWQPPQRENRVGVNLSTVKRWSSEQPFVNVLKTAGPLEPACGLKDACGERNDDGFEVDEHGYPTSTIPTTKDQKGWDRARAAPLLHDQGSYRRDRFVVLYDGEGELAYGAGIQQKASKPGREEIHYQNPNGGYLSIVKTNPDNPIRNIRVVAEEFEQSYLQQPFDPQFLEVIGPFSMLRFINWMQANDEPAFEWHERPTVATHSWMKTGVPVEIMVRLANTVKADPWFTLPHNSTQEYQTKFASYVQEHLHPSLTAYFELSNEVWNDIFPQTKWARALGDFGQPPLPAFSISQNYGYEAAKMCRTVRPVFKGSEQRFKCVAGTHTGWPERATWVLDCPGYRDEIDAPCYKWGGFDLLAVTTYFGNIIGRNDNAEMDSWRHIKSWRKDGDDAAKEKMFDYLATGRGWYNDDRHDIPATFEKIDRLTAYARERGLGLIAYEGGTHLVAAGNIHDDADAVEWIKEVNRHERMSELYAQMFENWHSDEYRDLICHFSSVSIHGPWGSWGLLENMWDETTPRYRAVLDYIDGN